MAGKKWKKVTSGTTASLSAVFFLDEKQGWVVGANGTIRRSQDGGNTWQQQLVDTQVPFYGLSFVSPSEGWVVGGNGTILHTKDGGTHWVDQASKTSAALYGIQFLTARHGTVVGAVGTVLMTDDGGITWIPQETQGAATLFDVYFHGYIDRVGRWERRSHLPHDRWWPSMDRSHVALHPHLYEADRPFAGPLYRPSDRMDCGRTGHGLSDHR